MAKATGFNQNHVKKRETILFQPWVAVASVIDKEWTDGQPWPLNKPSLLATETTIINDNHNDTERSSVRFILQLRMLKYQDTIPWKFCATHQALITCGMFCARGTEGHLGYQVWQGWNRFYLALFHWLKPLTNEGEEAKLSGQNSRWRASANATY